MFLDSDAVSPVDRPSGPATISGNESATARTFEQRKEEPWLQPIFYNAFQCIGAACEDTCCEGLGVYVDKATYEKYQIHSEGELATKLHQLVTIKDTASDSAYASIQLAGARCPFLADGLCSIQKHLGEDHLSHTCATYPRILNTFDRQRERSLDLSCPEAARLALLNDKPIEFSGSFVSEGSEIGVRKLVLQLLQTRRYPISKRLILVGHVCDKWSELEGSLASEKAKGEFLEHFCFAVNSGLYDAHLQQRTAHPATQLSIVLDLMVARLHLDYTPPRYLDLYREMVSGLELVAGASPETFGLSYSTAYSRFYAPFMKHNEHMLENYLVSYAFKTMFPFGAPSVSRVLNSPTLADNFLAQYMLMASYYSISKAVMIGLAGQHKSNFGAQHVVRSIQSISRTLEHCEIYPRRLLRILANKGIKNSAQMDVLTQN
jgi:lysine-N-methylase